MLTVFTIFLQVLPDSFRNDSNLWLVFVFCVALNVVLSCMTAFRDPGVVPPVHRPPPGEEPSDDTGMMQLTNPIVEDMDPMYLSDVFSLPYCRTCRHVRPKYAAHCKMCDMCVTNFDHHCIVLGCCVGDRNVGCFIAYLFSVSFSSAYGSILLALSVRARADPLTLASPETYVHVLLFLFGVGTAIGTGFFAVYYAGLTLSGKTSKQFLTGSSQSSAQGVLALLQTIVSPRKSYLPMYRSYIASSAPACSK